MMGPRFIFMLTRSDVTIPDALARLPEVLGAGVNHIGFKDVGLPLNQMKRLAGAIRAGGATLYLETVSLDGDSESASARAAVELGVDVLMGGTRPELVLPIIHGTDIQYYPFPGEVVGHPSVLRGTVEEIVASAKALLSLSGVHGLDLLAYRFAGDVPSLIQRVCRAAAEKPVLVAGSINRSERVTEALNCGADGFTVGTAALDGAFCSGSLVDELAAIMKAAARG